MKIKVFFNILLLFILLGCNKNPQITITRDYIYNSNWSKNNRATVSIIKAKLNDSINTINIDSLDSFTIHNNIVRDKNFHYITSFNKDFNSNRIYFDTPNGNLLWVNKNLIADKKDILGKLELNTWYIFDSYLQNSWIYYVYIDKSGYTHTWSLNPVNI